jgi:hypothetical protein
LILIDIVQLVDEQIVHNSNCNQKYQLKIGLTKPAFSNFVKTELA